MPLPLAPMLRQLDIRPNALPGIRDELAEYGIAIHITTADGEQWINVEPECWPETSIIAEHYFHRFES